MPVFLLEPDRTQFDLNFRLFGIHIRVHPLFWLLAAFLGYSTLKRGVEYLLIWVACVFVSILIHEMGHVFMGRLFGTDGRIVLFTFGGLAVGSKDVPNAWKRMAVSFAGPLVQFVLWGLLFLAGLCLALQGPLENQSPILLEILNDMLWINLAWPILNLLPIWPLDGGQISRDFLGWLVPRKGARLALVISFVIASLLAINSLLVELRRPLIPFLAFGDMYTAILFAMLAVGSYMEMQRQADIHRHWDFPDDRWENRRDRW